MSNWFEIRFLNYFRDYYERYSKNPFGWTYTERNAVYSFRFEEADLYYWHTIVGNHPEWALYATIIYLTVIFGIQRYMRDRVAFQLKWTLFTWNFCLGIFSIMGFARTLPGFLIVLGMPHGLYHSICSKIGSDIPTGFWTVWMIKCWSFYVIFCFDWFLIYLWLTFFLLAANVHSFQICRAWRHSLHRLDFLCIFIKTRDSLTKFKLYFAVLRKRPLIFLQWYHHVVTMSSVWILGPMVEPICRWYMVLNYGVHSLMYPYFAFKVDISFETIFKFVILYNLMLI